MIAPANPASYAYLPPGRATAADSRSARADDASPATGPASNTLSPEERREVAELQKRDREVRAHELAHVAAGAGLVTRGASFTYETGPDGQRYAVAGEVGIDTSPGRTPEDTLQRADQVRAAALAPADPSPQDLAVAAAAARMALEARLEIATERQNGETPDASGAAPATEAERSAATAARFAPDALSPAETGRLIDLFA